MEYVYAKSGERHKALEILNEFVKRSNQEYVPALNFAQIYAGRGDHDQALGWLEKACNERKLNERISRGRNPVAFTAENAEIAEHKTLVSLRALRSLR